MNSPKENQNTWTGQKSVSLYTFEGVYTTNIQRFSWDIRFGHPEGLVRQFIHRWAAKIFGFLKNNGVTYQINQYVEYINFYN